MMQLSERTSNSFWMLDLAHWQKVRAARVKAGLWHTSPLRAPVASPLTGKLVKSLSGKTLVIEKVVMEWFGGCFEVAHMRQIDHPAGVLDAVHPVRNVSSKWPGIEEAAQAFYQRYTPVPFEPEPPISGRMVKTLDGQTQVFEKPALA